MLEQQDHPLLDEIVQTLDEMRDRKLLNPSQHGEIAAWIATAKTPDAIQQMPTPLWRALALASVLMNVDAELTQSPLFAYET